MVVLDRCNSTNFEPGAGMLLSADCQNPSVNPAMDKYTPDPRLSSIGKGVLYIGVLSSATYTKRNGRCSPHGKENYR
jgi:hypothetical protein